MIALTLLFLLAGCIESRELEVRATVMSIQSRPLEGLWKVTFVNVEYTDLLDSSEGAKTDGIETNFLADQVQHLKVDDIVTLRCRTNSSYEVVRESCFPKPQ